MDSRLRVLIVDDEPLARHRIRDMLKGDAEVAIIGEARNGTEAIAAIDAHSPDVVFLDVQMPDIDGFEVLKRIPPRSIPLIIFVTAYDQHALRAFEVHAIDYLLKPFDRKRFSQALTHAKAQIKLSQQPQAVRILRMLEELKSGPRYLERFAIRNGDKIVFVRAEDIDSIHAEGNYVRLDVGRSSYLLRDTLNSIESQIDPRTFVRIHRSTMVNARKIKEVEIWSRGEYRVVLSSGISHPVSRRYRDHFDKLTKTTA